MGEQEKAMALKIGRQKKIQIIDGQQDVVLEVIQLPENASAENNTTASNSGGATVKIEPKSGTPMKASAVRDNSTVGPPAAKKARVDSQKKQADLASAFGFDSDDDEDE